MLHTAHTLTHSESHNQTNTHTHTHFRYIVGRMCSYGFRLFYLSFARFYGSISHSKCILWIESIPMKHKIKGNHRSITQIYPLHINCFYILWRTKCTIEWHRWRWSIIISYEEMLLPLLRVYTTAKPQKYHQHCLCNICYFGMCCTKHEAQQLNGIGVASECSRVATYFAYKIP